MKTFYFSSSCQSPQTVVGAFIARGAYFELPWPHSAICIIDKFLIYYFDYCWLQIQDKIKLITLRPLSLNRDHNCWQQLYLSLAKAESQILPKLYRTKQWNLVYVTHMATAWRLLSLHCWETHVRKCEDQKIWTWNHKLRIINRKHCGMTSKTFKN